jgi:hypothetical protein
MTKRRTAGAEDPGAKVGGEDDLIRLVRTIGRQAAQETFMHSGTLSRRAQLGLGCHAVPPNSKTGRTK